MKYSKASHYNHHVHISSTNSMDELYVSWEGHYNRHCYLIAENIQDLDILISELSQALNNYRRLIEKGLALEAPKGMYNIHKK